MVIMDTQLSLSHVQHDLVWKRREALESRFNVQIESPVYRTDNPYKLLCNYFNGSDIVIISVKGEVASVESFEKYVNEAFVRPQIIEIFSYHEDLKPIFRNTVFIETFEQMYDVCININPDCELNISGTESSVSSVVSTMEEIIAQYNESKDLLLVHSERSLSQRLVSALKFCKNVDIPVNTFHGIPNDVIKLLLSLLRKAYKEKFPACDDSSSLEDSVIILDSPIKKTDITVIILDTDSDGDNNSKRCLEDCSSENIKTKKKKRSHKARYKSKKGMLQCDPDLQGKCGLENLVIHEKDCVQSSEVESSTDRRKQPIIDNPNFIPLSLESTNNNSTARVPPNGANQAAAEGQIQFEEEASVIEEIPSAPKRLRPIVIDGCNVAFYCTQGRREDFSWKRIEISMHYFLNRGHTDVKIFIPQYRRPLCYEKSGNQNHVEKLENEQLIVFTPSRKIDGRTVSCYDDRFIVDLAYRNGGIILSNDNYRDLMVENVEWSKTIKQRLLMYVFAGDELMIPEDPLGSRGPRLNDFLAFPEENE